MSEELCPSYAHNSHELTMYIYYTFRT